MVKIYPSAVKPFFLLTFLCYAALGHAGITLDSVRSTPSTCADNGIIIIYAQTTASSISFAITSGPVTFPSQSSDQFNNLPSGAYELLISDNNHDTLRVADTVKGNYSSPNFTATYQNPECPGTATGIIVGNPQTSGSPPYSWVLTDLTTNTTTTQASDTFYDLAAGSYSLREYDSCQNYATYDLTLTTPTDSFTIESIVNRIFDCDSVSVLIELHVISGTPATPYTIKVQTMNGSYQHTVTDIVGGGNYPKIYENVGGVSYGDSIGITITDACGRSVYMPNTVADFNISETFSAVTDSCHVNYIANFFLEAATGQTHVNTTDMPEPITVIISNASSGAFIDSTVTNDPVNHFSQSASSAAQISGQSYKVEVRDGCGNIYTATLQWPSAPAPSTTTNIINLSCMDSTAAEQIVWINTFLSRPTFTLLSGPTSIHSTKPHYVYYDTIIYPQTYLGDGSGASGFYIQLTNLAVGTYHYSVTDSCGNSLTDSFSIIEQNLNNDHFAIGYIKGCPGQNEVVSTFDAFCSAYLVYGSSSVPLTYPDDTTRSLSSGSYVLSLHYLQTTYEIPVNANASCQVILDTIVIPPYQSPAVSGSDQVVCHGNVYVTLLPDSNTGVPPYQYQIISGPQTTAIQFSNYFILTQEGTYEVRISDSCGFAGTYTFYLDTASFFPVTNLGATCLGNSATLSCQYSPSATYIWQLPSGGIYTGDSLVIDPIVQSDYGVYTIRKIVSVDGCHDTIGATYDFRGTGTSSISQEICPGGSFVLGTQTITQAGVYYDTIPASPCDSIVTLTLSIRSPLYDSVSQFICPGQSVSVGIHTYNSTGLYRDTIATAGCDSIHVLSLTVGVFGQGSVSQTICPGSSYVFGTQTLTQAGVYYDTVAGSTCDSIVTLTLSIQGPLYDSVSQFICPGQSIIEGTHAYTSTGIYRDTIPTASCDSIYVLNLTVGSFGHSSMSAIICPGSSYVFGAQTLTQAGVYYDTVAGSPCDSIVALTLTIRGPLYDSVVQSVCTGQSVTVGSNTYNTSGIYRDTFQTAGCDSIYVLNLTVGGYLHGSASVSICPGTNYVFGNDTLTQAGVYYDTVTSGSCDSIVTLTLSIKGPVYDSVSQTICPGQSVTVGSNSYNSTGVYSDTFVLATGCDSIYVLNLHVNSYGHGAISASVCPGQDYIFGNDTLSLAGTYYDTLPTSGCDSIVTLTLAIRGPVYDSVSQTLCQGQSVTVGGNTYTTTGVYTDSFLTAGGCDSFHILSLQVNSFETGSVSASMCPGQNYVFGGNTLTQAGTYYDTIPTAGCDSIVTLTLIIRGPVYDSVSQYICTGQSVIVGTHTYSSTGVYSDTFVTSGCDSIHVLNLSVGAFSQGTATATICQGQSIQFGGRTLTQAGVYNDTIATAGCDSIVTMTLSVTPFTYDSAVQNICPGQSVTVGTHSYTTTGIYKDTFATSGCDSIYVLNLQVGSFSHGSTTQIICPGGSLAFGTQTLTQAGVYYDTVPTSGCDSIITLTLSIRGPLYDSVSQSICIGQSVTVGANTYSTTGIYRDTFQTAGCDSVYVLNLQVGSYLRGSASASICPGGSYAFGSQTLTQAGTYYDTLTTATCDSIAALTLSIRPLGHDSASQTICPGQSVTIGTHTYTSSGIFRDTFATAGCDSVFVLNLIVTGYGHGTMAQTICPGQSLHFGGRTLTSAGTYYDTVFTSGCDSIITLNLAMGSSSYDTATEIICTGQSITIGTHTYTQSGTYLDTLQGSNGCDSVLTTLLTVSPLSTPSVNITVTAGPVIAGMQIDTFTATYSDCPDPYFSWFQELVPLGIHTPVAVVSYPVGSKDSILCRIDCQQGCPADAHSYSNSIFTGINDLSAFILGVNIYPNPTQGVFNIDISTSTVNDWGAHISVIDMVGQSISTRSIVLHPGDNRETISIDEATSGVYIIQLTVDGQSLYYRLVLNK